MGWQMSQADFPYTVSLYAAGSAEMWGGGECLPHPSLLWSCLLPCLSTHVECLLELCAKITPSPLSCFMSDILFLQTSTRLHPLPEWSPNEWMEEAQNEKLIYMSAFVASPKALPFQKPPCCDSVSPPFVTSDFSFPHRCGLYCTLPQTSSCMEKSRALETLLNLEAPWCIRKLEKVYMFYIGWYVEENNFVMLSDTHTHIFQIKVF